MIGIVVVTHSSLGQEFLAAAEMIVGPFPRAEAVSIDRSLSVEVAQQQLDAALKRVGSDDDGVLILTDLFGGTPTNISAEFLSAKVEILAGINLPMLLKCISARQTMSVESLAAMLKDYARNAIMRPAELLQRD